MIARSRTASPWRRSSLGHSAMRWPRPSAESMRAPILEVGIALVAAFSVRAALTQPFEISPGDRAFRRLVGGATPSGRVPERAVVSIPSVRRSARAEVRLEVEGGVFRLGIDGGRAVEGRPSRDGIVVTEQIGRA